MQLDQFVKKNPDNVNITHGILIDEQQTDPLVSQSSQLSLRTTLKKYRSRVTPYLSKLIKNSPAVAKQFIPSIYEAESYGFETTFEEGKDNKGIYGLERIYQTL